MTKYLLILIIYSNCVLGQIWKYPNVPYGFVDSDKAITNQIKKGIESELIITFHNNDTISSELCFYDSLGRQTKRIIKNDTITCEYNLEGLNINKESSKGVELKFLKHNKKGQLINLITTINSDTTINVNYIYKKGYELPISLRFQNGNKEERTYYQNGNVKDVLFYQGSKLLDSTTYTYLEDSIFYSSCNRNLDNNNWTCEQVIGVFDKENRISRIQTKIPNGQEIVISTIKYQYNKKGKLKSTSDSLTNSSYGKLINFYNKKGHLIKREFYSEGIKVRTMIYTNIE